MSTRRATAVAFAIAVVVLVVAVLPAEYGIDPLGTGRALGLTALAGPTSAEAAAGKVNDAAPSAPVAASPQAVGLAQDTYTVELRPFEAVEYKYRLEQGRGLVYEWTTSAPVEWDFHGEPDGSPARYSESYEKGHGHSSNGAFIAKKPGIHGWFWENQGATRVTVTLKTSGFYSASTEFRDGERTQRTFGVR
ncbi:MAG TPA: hypothetical protein VMZ90_05700 [Vicinamibacterales bacterium]|nr:hypothetical protein [Vicinamibacterales bacterium]